MNENSKILTYLTYKTGNLSVLSLAKAREFIKIARQNKLELTDIANLSNEKFSKIFSEKFDYNNIISLLTDRVGLSLELEKLNSKGIYITTIFDDFFPEKLKQKIPNKTSPIFYYCGDIEILKLPLVGFVGSRDINENDLKNIDTIVEYIKNNNYGIVSGGAKGVDEASIDLILEKGGKAVVFLDSDLNKYIKEPKIFNQIIENNLLVITSHINKPNDYKEKIGLLDERNKYIYCSSSFTIVIKSIITSERKLGGTYNGVLENFKNKYTSTFCLKENYNGNIRIINEQMATGFDLNSLDILKPDFLNDKKEEKKNSNYKQIQLELEF